MTRKDIILATLSSAKGACHTPVQVQKLFFLIDKEISGLIGGPYFDFQPYNYGPFDKNVYTELMTLASEGYVGIVPENTWLSYRLTDKGQEEGEKIFRSLQEKAQAYIKVISEFVRSLSFEQLVSVIYKAYPEMQENSVFQSCR